MIQLIRHGKNRYTIVIEADGFMREYDADGVVDMLLYLAVKPEEIDLAMQSLIRNDHFVAEFGGCNTFMYSRPARAEDPIAA